MILVMDVDGTLTDGQIHIGPDGEFFKSFDVKDGLGIHEILPKIGVTPVIITGRSSSMLARRCSELGIVELHQGVSEKAMLLREILAERKLSLASVAYIGDDLNDCECMLMVKQGGGVVGCPHDAVREVRDLADFVSRRNGGRGAVREFIDWLK